MKACKQCGECCKMGVYVFFDEAINIVKKYKTSLYLCYGEVLKTDCKADEEVHFSTSQNFEPCKFLKNNKCSIYKDRPRYCREYPYEDGKISEFPFTCKKRGKL